MIEICTEFGRLKATNQRLTDQVRTIRKNGWFSDLEILEIHHQIYSKHIKNHLPQNPRDLTQESQRLQTQHDNDSCTANA